MPARRAKVSVRTAVTALLCAGPALVLGACFAPGDRAPPPNWNASDPFAPVTLRIYPLTHVERTGAGPARLVCHVEFTDRWYDTVKALGHLDVQLYRAGDSAGAESQRARWDIDLTDLERNAEWFDPVTRTYRVQLDLPPWADDGPGSNFRLRAVFTPPGGSEQSSLRDELVIRG